MNIIVVTQYYPPEPGATQNRLSTFAEGLVERGHSVTVVCEQPNHPAGVFHEGFGRRAVVTERRGPLTVRRVWVAASPRKTTARRAAFYGTFAVGAFSTVLASRGVDVVFATSPPLPGAVAVAAATKLRRLPLITDVRDIWPAAAEALGELRHGWLMRQLERAERYLYRCSSVVTATTRPFCAHIDAVAARRLSVHLPNGALDALIRLPDPGRPPRGTFIVGYAGNLGIAQGLGIVLDAAERLGDADVRFRLIGDGPIKEDLLRERDRRSLDERVEMLPSVPCERVGDLLLGCDTLLVPLRDHPLLESFVPSKIYDAMAVGRPTIVAARGEATDLVRKYGCGVTVPPEDGGALAGVVRDLAADRPRVEAMGRAGRAAALAHMRSSQVDRLEQVLLSAAAERVPAQTAG